MTVATTYTTRFQHGMSITRRSGITSLKLLALLCLLGILWTLRSLDYTRSQFRESQMDIEIRENTQVANYLIRNPVHEIEFAEMGRRIRNITEWLTRLEGPGNAHAQGFQEYELLLEKVIVSHFPFISHPSAQADSYPFRHLRESFVPGSRGVVIPTGINTFRYACHLIFNLRSVLNSTLPIEIAYAGDEDLPFEHRSALLNIGQEITFLDVTKVLDDTTLQLSSGGWAIKPFAILASRFEQVILMDADVIFFQPPENIFNSHHGYLETGTLFFHDRLVFKGYSEGVQEFWHSLMRNHTTSANFNNSIVMNEGYLHEAESGVVVIDKGRLPVLMGLLHACWENTDVVRINVTYVETYGDKETYWMGMEFSDVPYTFAEYYEGIIGEEVWNEDTQMTEICGSMLAHVDEKRELLWLNGGLVRRKDTMDGRLEFVDARKEAQGIYGIGGDWVFTGNSEGFNFVCMRNAAVTSLDVGREAIITDSVLGARGLDIRFGRLMGLPASNDGHS